MHGRNSFEDELARRRAARQKQAGPESDQQQDEEIPQFSWKDILAMCIAAYQIVFPILLVLVAAMVLAFLLFRWYFS